MIHQLYYEGRLMGEVENPFSWQNHAWFCRSCGRLFAERRAPENIPGSIDGPFKWTVWDSLCAQCLSQYKGYWDVPAVAEFHRGGDATSLANLRAQFLYEATAMNL